jgi:hypothetical protein
MRRNKTEIVISALLLAIFAALGVNAAGPLNMWNKEQRIPYRWDVSSPVKIYTDSGPWEVIPPQYTPVTNERADEVVAFAAQQWSSVSTTSFRAEVVGDFASIGLPDVSDAATAAQVIGVDNGGGLHVIYDAVNAGTTSQPQGKVLKEFFGAPPGVLGIASPEYADEATGTITEGWMILNSQQRYATDPQLLTFAGVFTHEMGHAINLAHSQTNGFIIFSNDTRGPKSCGTTLPYETTVDRSHLETMYPFANVNPAAGVGTHQSTIDRADDMSSISNLYPSADYMSSKGSIKGRILQTDGETGYTGINVIARNLDNPYVDAVSAISGDYVRVATHDDGSFTINGLAPGARYALYTDTILQGGYPTALPLYVPGSEEFYNGANESGNGITDDLCQMEAITAVAGQTTTADIILNSVKGAPKFTPLVPGATARTISADGHYIGGAVGTGGAFRWSEEGGYEVFSQFQGAEGWMSRDGMAFASNRPGPDGRATAAYADLTAPTPVWQLLPFAPVPLPWTAATTCSSASSALRISPNGKSVGTLTYVDTNGPLAGQNCRTRASIWTAGTGTQLLSFPTVHNATNVRVTGMTDDLSTIVGSEDSQGLRRAVRWVNGTYQEFSTPSFTVGEAQYVTPDGKTIVGGSAGNTQTAWVWTQEGGVVQLARVAPNFAAFANAASDNGKVIAGIGGSYSQFPGDASGNRAFLWTPELGSVDFENFLQAQGTFFEGWILWSTSSMTSDGTIHTGTGVGPRGGAGWKVDMTKVNICHAPPGNPRNAHTINVPFVGAMADHLKHGDTIGFCAESE